MKYLASIIISVALFQVFRPNHDYTFKTWLLLFIIHAPVPALMFVFETARTTKIHPVVCFLCTWIGGLVLAFLVGLMLIVFGGNPYTALPPIPLVPVQCHAAPASCLPH